MGECGCGEVFCAWRDEGVTMGRVCVEGVRE